MSMNWKPMLESLETRETPAVLGLKSIMHTNMVIYPPSDGTGPVSTSPPPTSPPPTSPPPTTPITVVIVTPPTTPWTP